MLEIHPERTELTDLNRDDRERLRPWVAVGLLLALGLFLAILGCEQAPLPVCKKYQGEMVQYEDGRIGVFIDMPNIKKLGETMRGIAEGTCRIEAPKPQGKPV